MLMRSSSAADDLVWYLWGNFYLSFLQLLQLFLQLPAATWQHLAVHSEKGRQFPFNLKLFFMIVQYPSDLQQLPLFITTWQCKISSERLQIFYSVVIQSCSEATCVLCNCAWVCVLCRRLKTHWSCTILDQQDHAAFLLPLIKHVCVKGLRVLQQSPSCPAET